MGGGQNQNQNQGNSLMDMLNPMTSPMAPHNMMSGMFGGNKSGGGNNSGMGQQATAGAPAGGQENMGMPSGNGGNGKYGDLIKYLQGFQGG